MPRIIDVLTSPWAIQPEKLIEIQSIYTAHARGRKNDLAAIEAAIGKPLNNEPKGYTVTDGVAVLPISGIVAKRMNLFNHISGGVSTELVARDLQAALDDPQVRAIVLQIDSPGGTVDGTQVLSDIIFQARGRKRIVALADGLMASAAYWFGSAAEQVYISDETTHTGSIGVVTTHTDVSKAEEKLGRKTTEIYAGKYKRIDSSYKPLSGPGREYLQEQVDYIYSVFVGDVARNRGASEETVLQNMADGRVFIGQQAIDAGLADGIVTLDALVADLSEERAASAPLFASNHHNNKGETEMDITMEKVLAEAPDVAEALRAEGHAKGLEEGKAGLADAATAERERIQAVEAQALPGHEDLIAAMKFDGKTTGAQAAVAVLNAEKKLRAQNGSAMAADSTAAAAPFAPAPESGHESDDVVAEGSVEDKAKAAWDKSESLRAEFGSFDTYLAFEKNNAAGNVRILGRSK